MTIGHEISPIYPSTWAQVYALGYGELQSILYSFLDDNLTRDEVREHVVHQADVQHTRVARLARDSVKPYTQMRPRA